MVEDAGLICYAHASLVRRGILVLWRWLGFVSVRESRRRSLASQVWYFMECRYS